MQTLINILGILFIIYCIALGLLFLIAGGIKYEDKEEIANPVSSLNKEIQDFIDSRIENITKNARLSSYKDLNFEDNKKK